MTLREAQSETNEASKMRIKAIYERIWNEGLLDEVDTIFAPTIIRHEPPNVDIVGLDAYKQMIIARRTAFPDLTLHLDETISEGTIRAGRWHFCGTCKGPLLGVDHPPIGKYIEISGLFFVHTVNDQNVEEWIYGDTLGMFQQLGLLPPLIT